MAKSAARAGEKESSPEIAFGKAIKELRIRRQMTQAKLGAEAGYSEFYIRQLEHGRSSPTLTAIFNLAKTLEVSPVELMKATMRRVRS